MQMRLHFIPDLYILDLGSFLFLISISLLFPHGIQDPDLKMTPIRSVTEISCAIQDADDSQSFQFTYKEELLGYMLDFMKEEPIDSLASPVRLRAMLAFGHLRAGTKRHLQGSGHRLLSLQLGKVKPSLNLDENRNILDDCLKRRDPRERAQEGKMGIQ
ncbi:maestro heat-like repeat-containing protein family member 2B [Alligator sinensis]|uniref:Maestro heat-like repeat-containing protein family member 2B n=1 Tax=Alligator sinensis TaxID=38654 RepID=A0A3Q0HIE6_ALLSI|nr:maestro heat-like repeat-containing protein family member 2B [Alligator sinensis]